MVVTTVVSPTGFWNLHFKASWFAFCYNNIRQGLECISETRLRWSGHVQRRDSGYWTKDGAARLKAKRMGDMQRATVTEELELVLQLFDLLILLCSSSFLIRS